MASVVLGGDIGWRPPPKLPDVGLEHRRGALIVHCRSAISSWNAVALGAFRQLLCSLEDDVAERTVVLCGDLAFCSPVRFDDVGRALQPDLHDLTTSLAQATRPVIAAITGGACGAGLEIALACTERIAGPHAMISMPEARLGLLPINGGLERLASLAGLRTTGEILGCGRVLDAAEAQRAQIVDRVVNGDLVEFILGGWPEVRGERPASRLPKTTEDLGCQILDLSKWFRKSASGQEAPKTLLRALEHACQFGVQKSVRETRRLNAVLGASDQSRALQYAAALDLDAGPDATEAELLSSLEWNLVREAIHLVDEGATPSQVDRTLMAFGFSRALFLCADRAGLSALAARARGLDAWRVYSPTLDLLVEAGRLGRISGAGWYRYAEGGEACADDRMLVPLLEESAIAQRLRRRVLDDQEVLTRCLAALVHGAAKLIEDGVVLDAAEIDRLWNRLGFPRWRGGLLYAFSRGGLPDLAALWRGSPPPRNTLGAPCALLQSWMMGGDPLARAEFGEKVGALKSQRH